MLSERIKDLIQKELDGANSKRDSAELRRVLKRNREASRLYKELQITVKHLAETSPAHPPADLERKILKSISTTRTQHVVRYQPNKLKEAIMATLQEFPQDRKLHKLLSRYTHFLGNIKIFDIF